MSKNLLRAWLLWIKAVHDLKQGSCETSYGEPQAWAYLKNGRSLEITLEEYGLSKSDWFYSVRLHCTDEEFDDGYFSPTCGVIENCATGTDKYSEILPLIKLCLKADQSVPITTETRRRECVV